MNVIKCDRLLFLFLLSVILLLGRLSLLSSDTTWTSTTEWRGKGEVDVLLGVETDDERWDVDDLLSDTIMHLLGIRRIRAFAVCQHTGCVSA